MKALILAMSLFKLFTAYGAEVNCTNQSLYWPEDSLYLNLEKMSGSYFDNDSHRELKCTMSEFEEEKGYIYCHESGNTSNLITRIKPNGDATLIYSFEQWVDFSCNL